MLRSGELTALVDEWTDVARRRWGGLLPDESGPLASDGPRTRRSTLLRPTALGFVATLAITVGVAIPSSPFTLKQPGAWFFGIPGFYSHSGQGLLLLGLVLVYGGMLLLCRVWYELTQALARSPGVPVTDLVVVFAVWVLPLLVAPPLFSKDVYSYAAQGEMVSHHISPYQYGPNTIGAGPYTAPVDQLWGNAAAPYGPLFLGAAGLITRASGHHELGTVIGLRLLALLGVVLIAVFVPRLARLHGRDAGAAFALAVLNPLTLLHLVGGAHNDALMIGLLVAGITLAKSGRPALGIVVCALAAAVKVPAALGIVYIGWNWVGEDRGWRERVRPLVSSFILAGMVMAVLSLITGLGWGWLWALGTPGTVKSWLAPATALGMIGGHITHAIGIGPSAATVLSLARGLSLVIALVVAVALLRFSNRIGTVRAIAISLLVFVALGPVVQPWYLAWGLVMLAPVATGRQRALLIWLSIISAFIGLPGGRLLLDELGRASPAAVIFALLVLIAIPFTPLASWGRRLVARFRSSVPAT